MKKSPVTHYSYNNGKEYTRKSVRELPAAYSHPDAIPYHPEASNQTGIEVSPCMKWSTASGLACLYGLKK